MRGLFHCNTVTLRKHEITNREGNQTPKSTTRKLHRRSGIPVVNTTTTLKQKYLHCILVPWIITGHIGVTNRLCNVVVVDLFS